MNITGLNNINADDIICSTLTTNNISNDELNTLKGSNIHLTLQSQINTLNQYVSNGSSGGGFFSISAGCPTGFSTTNPFWNFGGSGVSSTNIPLIFNFDFKVNSISFTCGSVPSTQATVQLYKNGSSVYTMPNINSLSNTFNNMNVIFLAGDTLNLYTSAGAAGTSVKATISCSVGGVVGATPQLSVGTVSSLSSTSQPTVSITGTTLNPVLNFGLVQGIQGIQGLKGDTGSQGPQGPKGDQGDSSAQTQTNTLAIAGLVTAVSVINDHLGIIDGEILTIGGEISTLQGEVSTINDEITSLQGKTQFITANQTTNTTAIQGNFNVGSSINPTSFNINSSTGAMSNTGDITVNNSSGGSTIVLSSNLGKITANSINTSNIIEGTNTASFGQSTNTATNIQGGNVNIGAFGSSVFIAGVPYNPFSATSSFFSQW